MGPMADRALLFTAPFIFTPEVYDRLGLFALPSQERELLLRSFWRTIISSGKVGFIYFREGYERSPGSLDELETAKQHGAVTMFEAEF